MIACAALLAPLAARAAACPDGLRPTVVAEVLMGRNVGDRLGVSGPAFRRFVAEEVAPRFPSGFTVLDAEGAYRDAATGRTRRERAKVLVVALGDAGRDWPRVREVAEAYRARFRQQSVGLIARETCAAF